MSCRNPRHGERYCVSLFFPSFRSLIRGCPRSCRASSPFLGFLSSSPAKPGLKPLARNSSDSVVGVPIKKRRFPFVRSPSQTPSSPQEESDLPEKEKSNSKLEVSLSNASSATEVSGIADTDKKLFSEQKEESSVDKDVTMVQSNINPDGLDIGNSSITMASGSLVEMDIKGKPMVTYRSTFQMVPQNTELQLAQNEALAQQIEEDKSSKPKLKTNDKSKVSIISGNTESVLLPEQILVPASACQNSQSDCQEQEKLNPSSWKLSLSKEQNVQSRSNDAESKIVDSHPQANRSHWDLNTMMETWEGSMNDPIIVHGAVGVDVLVADGIQLQDIKPVICSTEMVPRELEGNGVTPEKHIFGESEHGSKLPSLLTPDQQYKSEDFLHLRLSPSCLKSSFSQELLVPSTKVNSKRIPADLCLSRILASPTSNLNLVGCKIAKSEPFDEGCEQDFKGANVSPPKLVDFRNLKSEPVEANNKEPLKSLNTSSLKLVDDIAVKSESVHKANQETLRTVEGISLRSEIHTCAAEVPNSVDALDCSTDGLCTTVINGQVSCASEFPICATELSISSDVSSRSENPICTKGVHATEEVPQEACEIVGQVTSDVVSKSVGLDSNETEIADGMNDVARREGLGGPDTEFSGLRLMDELHVNSFGNDEVAESDEEKFNISADMIEEDSYCTDYDSDGNHTVGLVIDTGGKQHGSEDDDYEDGEVREPLVHTESGAIVCEERETGHATNGESDSRNTDCSGFPVDDHLVSSSHVEDRQILIEDPGEIKSPHCSGVCDDIILGENNYKDINKLACLQETLAVAVPTAGSGKKMPIKAARRKLLNRPGREDDPNGNETEFSSDRSFSASQGTATGDGQSEQENVKGTVLVETSHLIPPKKEASVDDNEAVKAVNGRGSRSRIINLAQASNGPSPSRMRSIPSRPLPSRTEKEKITNLVFRGDKLHPRGSRGGSRMGGPYNLERERNQDRPVRNSGPEYMHGRGRAGRLDTPHGNWNSDRDFAPDHYNGPNGFRFPRPKIAASRLECDGYIITPGGSNLGAGRGGRKPLNEESPNFGHFPSRRRSPGGRGRPGTHGVQMVRRLPRDNISPDRCMSGSGPDLVGLRREEKFMRGLPDDMMDSGFSRSQSQYKRVDNTFVRGNRSFSPIQRRGPLHIPQIRSKSPPGFRTDSPGPWSPPRRSPDGFDGHPELTTNRRSPAMYRMRSPHQRPCFTEDMVARRHGSPPYMSRISNDMREMGSARERDHERSFIPNRRSPSGRVLPRSTRRFGMIDPLERIESDEYFGGPLNSGRFHELGGEGGSDERRKCSERRGPARSFRPPYNSAEAENFRFRVEDGPRPYRFCQESDSEFNERGSSREGEFDRRNKNRPGRRTRTIEEEQEENYRHGGEVWNDAGFDDVPRVKKGRF
ncbi:hypothetical protein HHK36_010897 [Tetracentron sinense]|uniref:Uncharacterized protein n=1 Tax=Tetracentron sinense TaxID=13715 RepID=A0A834ZB58_TETSI|nr:hypothetical protein HHK36_010897 [Tetracentron sinense]